ICNLSEVRIEGLETLDYLDNLHQRERFTEQGDALTFESERERFTEQGDALTFESELDRVYIRSPNVIAVLDHERKRAYVIRKEGLPDVAVVWNPWEKKSKAMTDLCVDGAAIEKPITLKPGEEWTGRLELSARITSRILRLDVSFLLLPL
ncbi:hypothetical protein Tsubulata_040527, partial [Turnera subulata]